jgi:hypothetical protein
MWRNPLSSRLMSALGQKPTRRQVSAMSDVAAKVDTSSSHFTIV